MAARLCLNVSSALLRRIRAEYLEMPGLRLTASQAQCLFGLDSETWDAALAALLDAKFLSRTHDGLFAMPAITGLGFVNKQGLHVGTFRISCCA